MLTPVRCLALRTVRLNDSRNLLSAWVEGHGLLTFAMTAGKSREAARRRALTSHMATFEAVADIRPGRDIDTLRDISPLPSSLVMASSPVQAAAASFLAEALATLLRDSPPDDALTAYLFHAADCFAAASPKALANFNISFLYHLAEALGVGPDIGDYGTGKVFDLRQAVFSPVPPLHPHFIPPSDIPAIALLARIPLSRCGLIRLPRHIRREIFDRILAFYSFHLTPIDDLESLKILRMIFE